MLGLLTASAFFMRLENFKNSELFSIDEIVYFRMGKQVLREGLSGYNTIPYGEDLAAEGRSLPDYFFQPLFKHPPIFTFLLSLSMKIFGVKLTSAGYVALIFGVLMVPLTYLLASLMFNRNVGILSAMFMWLDPVNIICSQKIWMETTLAFFMVLSIYLFMRGFKGQGDIFFVLGGLASGLAALTKYPGVLSMFIVLLYAAVHDCKAYKNKNFVTGLFMPILLLGLWFYWNYSVYGVTFFIELTQMHNIFLKLPRTFYLAGLAALLALVVFFNIKLSGKRLHVSRNGNLASERFDLKRKLVIFVGILLLVLIHKQVIHGLQFNYFPTTAWHQGLFVNEPPTFYIGRLIEFSAIYIFSFAAFFIGTSRDVDKKLILYLGSAIILIFFITWKNYQSRYILPAIPFLIILGIRFAEQIYQAILVHKSRWVQFFGSLMLKSALIYIVLKTCFLNAVISFPNDMCYF